MNKNMEERIRYQAGMATHGEEEKRDSESNDFPHYSAGVEMKPDPEGEWASAKDLKDARRKVSDLLREAIMLRQKAGIPEDDIDSDTENFSQKELDDVNATIKEKAEKCIKCGSYVILEESEKKDNEKFTCQLCFSFQKKHDVLTKYILNRKDCNAVVPRSRLI